MEKIVVKHRPPVTVGDFFRAHGRALGLSLCSAEVGFDRPIPEPTINRPGLALAGFYTYFARRRIQVIGSSELSYLRSLGPELMRQRFRELCSKRIPCIVVARKATVPAVWIEEAGKFDTPIFQTPMITMRFINAATFALENDFAPTLSRHGNMVDIHGIGTMICGPSGIGKSECVLGLIERGYSLVSDDITQFRLIDGKDLFGTSAALTRGHMEVRGLGIINVAAIFGAGCIRLQKKLDLIVTLQDWQELEEVDRIGLDQEYAEILGIKVPLVTIPVRPGRDIARLVEVAALDAKLKILGLNGAEEFNRRLLQAMQQTKPR